MTKNQTDEVWQFQNPRHMAFLPISWPLSQARPSIGRFGIFFLFRMAKGGQRYLLWSWCDDLKELVRFPKWEAVWSPKSSNWLITCIKYVITWVYRSTYLCSYSFIHSFIYCNMISSQQLLEICPGTYELLATQSGSCSKGSRATSPYAVPGVWRRYDVESWSQNSSAFCFCSLSSEYRLGPYKS